MKAVLRIDEVDQTKVNGTKVEPSDFAEGEAKETAEESRTSACDSESLNSSESMEEDEDEEEEVSSLCGTAKREAQRGFDVSSSPSGAFSLRSLCEAETDAHVFDVSFHPQGKHVVASLITGSLQIFSLSEPTEFHLDATLVSALRPHKTSCRTAQFLSDTSVISGGKDGRLVVSDVTDTSKGGRVTWKTSAGCRADGVNAIKVLGAHTAVAGDDEGRVTLWDLRVSGERPASSVREYNDYISDMALRQDGHTLLATSGDTLGVYDLRQPSAITLEAMSDEQGDDFLCVDLARYGQKVLCGNQTGAICLFSWGDFGDMNDRITGHPGSIDCLVTYDEQTIITGCQDGLIRAVEVFPNRIAGIIGAHNEAEMGVERLALNGDKTILASISHDCTINFYSTSGVRRLLSADERRGQTGVVPDMRASAGVFDDL